MKALNKAVLITRRGQELLSPIVLRTLEKLRVAEYRIVPKIIDLRKVTTDPVEAIYLSKGNSFLIEVPLERCRSFTPLAFPCKRGVGNPFVETIEAYLGGKQSTFRGSPLERFSELWAPENAADMLGLSGFNPSYRLLQAPPIGAVLPWARLGLEQAAQRRARTVRRENLAWGRDFGIEQGCPGYGALSEAKLELEFKRLTSVADSIRKYGFLGAARGFIRGELLVREHTYSVLITEGHHRISALAALGHALAHLVISPTPVHKCDARSWPNTKNGLYTAQQALSLFDRIHEGKQPAGCPKFGP